MIQHKRFNYARRGVVFMKKTVIIAWMYSALLFSADTHLMCSTSDEKGCNFSYNDFGVEGVLKNYEKITSITIKDVHLYHVDTPDEWTNFLSSLPHFTNLEELSLHKCDMISPIGGCCSIGLAVGWLGEKELKQLLQAVRDLTRLRQLNIATSFNLDHKAIKSIKAKLNKPDLVVH